MYAVASPTQETQIVFPGWFNVLDLRWSSYVCEAVMLGRVLHRSLSSMKPSPTPTKVICTNMEWLVYSRKVPCEIEVMDESTVVFPNL